MKDQQIKPIIKPESKTFNQVHREFVQRMRKLLEDVQPPKNEPVKE